MGEERRRGQMLNFLMLQGFVTQDEVVQGALFLRVIYSLQNSCRSRGAPIDERHLIDFCKWHLVRASDSSAKARGLARGLCGPPGPLRRWWPAEPPPPTSRRNRG